MDSTSVSLLRRLGQPNSESAWERFVDLYSPLIFHWGTTHGLSPDKSADLVQEVLAKMVVKMPEFTLKPGSRFRGWLRTVVVNQARDIFRSERRHDHAKLEHELPLLESANNVDLLEHDEYCRYLVARARDLMRSEFEDKTWNACWMYVAEGKSSQEVAAIFGMSENAVRVAKCRVLAKLRRELDGLLDFDESLLRDR